MNFWLLMLCHLSWKSWLFHCRRGPPHPLVLCLARDGLNLSQRIGRQIADDFEKARAHQAPAALQDQWQRAGWLVLRVVLANAVQRVHHILATADCATHPWRNHHLAWTGDGWHRVCG